MSAYTSYFKLRLRSGLTYRIAAWAGIATQLFFGFLFIMIYEAFYRAGGDQPISLSQLAQYIWLQQAFLALVALWFRDNELSNLIVSGDVAYELCRPVNLYGFWYARQLAHRLAAAALRSVPILLLTACLPSPYRFGLPSSWAALLGFVVTMLFGLGIVVAGSMWIHILTFLTLSPAGTAQVVAVLASFFSGGILAIPLMPAGLQRVLYALPFAYTADFPFRVYAGHIPPADLPGLLLRQSLWLVILVAGGALVLRRVLRRVVVQGG